MGSKVVIYSDGACRGNPGPGGWGVVLGFRDAEQTLKGYEPETTNNRMELTAVIEGLRALNRSCDIQINTDSKYVMHGITEWLENWKRNGWKTAARKPVKNVDLWRQLDEELQQHHKVEWRWIKGHSGNAGNEHADQLANAAIDAGMRA